MSRWLKMADGGEVFSQPPTDNMTKPDKTPSVQPEGAFCRVLSNCQVVNSEKVLNPTTEEMRHGFAINGHPKTWTGKVVSLDAWRQLSEWDRHGPDGRMWDGNTKTWRRK